MDNEQKKRVKNVHSAKKIKKSIILLTVILVVAAVLVIGISILNNYVIFPRIDKALVNSLEAKFDIGTRFDVTALLKKGKVELSADDMSHTDLGSADLDLSLSYKGKSAMGSLDFADKHLDAAITEDGVAASFSDVEGGNRYGAYFEDITSALDVSFLNPKNKAYNALSRSDYKKLLSTAQKLEESANEDIGDKKDTIIVLGEIAKVFKDSSLSDNEKSYDGIYVNGEKRNARTVTFEFGKADVVDLLKDLEVLFNDPSDKLRKATENLLKKESLTKDIESMGYSLDTCEDLAKFIGDIARLVDRIDQADVKLEIGYVNDAVSAIIFKCNFEKTTDIELVIDFGAKPKRDKTIYASLLVAKKHSSSQSERRYTFEYSVESVKKVNTVSAAYKTSMFIKDNDGEQTESSEYFFEMVLDTKNDTASFELEHSKDNTLSGSEADSLKNSYSINCSMKDSSSKLTLALLEMSVDGKKISDYMGNVSLTVSKKPDRIKLGEFSELLKMNIEEADKLAGSATSKVEDLWDMLKKLEVVALKTDNEDK